MTAVRDGIRRVAVGLGFPLELEVVNEAFQGTLLAVCPVMTREHALWSDFGRVVGVSEGVSIEVRAERGFTERF